MTEPNDTLPVLDKESALETTGGDAELAHDLQVACMSEAPKLIEAARVAVKEVDWVTARRQGHSLRSSFGTIGAKIAEECAHGLEHVEAEDANDFNAALDSLDVAYQQLADYLG
jgi:HPt (histidine-containing phosphotransfer) domain-containing protein